jgi:hypothetical protein
MRSVVLSLVLFAVTGCSSSTSVGSGADGGDGGGRGRDSSPGHDAVASDAKHATDDGGGGGDDSAVPEAGTPGVGDGSSLPDASKSADAESDGHDGHDASDGGNHGSEAGQDSGGVALCGGVTCYAGQSCLAGQCQYTDCVGDHVPGDYATIQDAVNALSGGGTICLAAQTYSEAVTAPFTTGPVNLQGAGPGQSIVTSFTVNDSTEVPSYSYSLDGISLGALSLNGSFGSGSREVKVTNSVIAATGDGANAVSVDDGEGTSPVSLTLDGVDVSSASTGGGIELFTESVDTVITVESSYIHGGSFGVNGYIYPADGVGAATIVLLNNTFENNATAIDFDSYVGSTLSVSLYNNLFVDNGVAIALTYAAIVGNNALYGNTTNYAGVATDGPGYVKANPLLDTSTPPGLLPGSPCRGAGNAAHAPTDDFYGKARGATPDIGAVQSSP